MSRSPSRLGEAIISVPPGLGAAYPPAMGRSTNITVIPDERRSLLLASTTITTLANEGPGTGLVFDRIGGSTSNTVAYLRTLQADPDAPGISVTTAGAFPNSVVNIGWAVNGANTAPPAGNAEGVYESKDPATGDLVFRTLIAGANITLTPGDNNGIIITSTSGSTPVDLWQYVADAGADTVVLNPAFPDAVFPANLAFPVQSTETLTGLFMLFDAGNGAFRAGVLDNAGSGNWTAVNRGAASVAFGKNALALGAGSAVVAGGTTANGGNAASGPDSFIGAGAGNQTTAPGAVVVGGGTFSSGGGNTATGQDSFIGSGIMNAVSGRSSFVGGGVSNTVVGASGTISGGSANAITSTEPANTISGGVTNAITGGQSSTIGGGADNIITADYGCIPGGLSNVVNGVNSMACGNFAGAHFANSFVWSDGSSTVDTASNQFVVSATGGTFFYTNAGHTTGATLASGASAWGTVSARHLKENLIKVDPADILGRVRQLPLYTYNYRGNPAGLTSLGPMADDWHRLFPSGKDPMRIETIDLEGVALSAIQGLALKADFLAGKVDYLEHKLAQVLAQKQGDIR